MWTTRKRWSVSRGGRRPQAPSLTPSHAVYRASGDDINSLHNTAYLTWQGQGTPQSLAFAQKTFQRLAKSGYPNGVYCVGQLEVWRCVPSPAPRLLPANMKLMMLESEIKTFAPLMGKRVELFGLSQEDLNGVCGGGEGTTPRPPLPPAASAPLPPRVARPPLTCPPSYSPPPCPAHQASSPTRSTTAAFSRRLGWALATTRSRPPFRTPAL